VNFRQVNIVVTWVMDLVDFRSVQRRPACCNEDLVGQKFPFLVGKALHNLLVAFQLGVRVDLALDDVQAIGWCFGFLQLLQLSFFRSRLLLYDIQ
jgi:hypothetical protein